MNWDEYFLSYAQLAKQRSKDQSTQIGAVVVDDDNNIISTGYNSFPRGIDDTVPERQERPEKYYWFEHGERNAIYCAARRGAALKGCRMYVTCSVPCTGCARAIINVGIVEVIMATEKQITHNKTKWDEEAIRSETMFEEAGVRVRYA